jgi:hypothetical protein
MHIAQNKGNTVKKLVLMISLFFSTTAMADYFSQSYNTYYAPTYIANNANLSSASYLAIKNQARDQLAEQQTKPTKSLPTNVQATGKASMSFVPSKTVANKTADLVLADLAKNAGVTLAKVKTELAAKSQTNFGPEMMSELTKSLGLPQNDLTSALTAFCVVAHDTLTGKNYPKGSAKIVYGNLDRSFGSSGAFGSLNNEQKQYFSDYLAWMSMLILQQRSRNLAATQKATLQLLNEFGLDLTKLERLSRV